MILIAGLFGHRHATEQGAVAWYHTALAWSSTHWAVLAVVIPVAGALFAGIVNHYLAVARENRARRVRARDVRARVHADLAARLLRHCTSVHGAVESGTLDARSWRAENANLHARAQHHDVVEALGRDYVSFMAAIENERRAVGNGDPYRVLEAYVPFISSFGQGKQARRLKRLLRG